MSCEYKNKCGGCHYTDINYEEELRLKEEKVLSLIRNIDSNFIYDGIIKSPLESEYKNKMEFTFGNSEKDGPLTLGMHQKRSFYNILNAENCELCDSVMRDILKWTRIFFDEKKIPHYHKKTHEGYLRHLILRKSFKNNEYIVNIVTTSNTDKQLLIDWSNDLKIKLNEKYNKIKINIIHTFNDKLSDAVINEGIEILNGNDSIEEELLGKIFNISPFSFFQTNTKACEKLYEKIREYARENESETETKTKIDKIANIVSDITTDKITNTKVNKTVDKNDDDKKIIYDMFCGTGTIGIILSDISKKIIGVEIIPEAIEKAKENCIKNNVKNAEYIAKDINQVVKDNDDIVFKNKPDLIVLDPPRGGVNDKTLESISELNARKIIYVSCKIESFVNNFSILKSRGYVIEKICLVDMFPHTDNVETIILMKNIKNM